MAAGSISDVGCLFLSQQENSSLVEINQYLMFKAAYHSSYVYIKLVLAKYLALQAL